MIRNIQALRFFAALVVVWHHVQPHLNDYFGANLDTWFGISGVDIFFVISGFIMFHTVRGFRKRPQGFWADRVVRIAPLYWAATTMIIILYQAGLRPAGVMAIDAGDVMSAYAFLPNIRADGMEAPILTVGWTLIYEMFFYVLFGLTFFLRSRVMSLTILTGLFMLFWMAKDLADLSAPYWLNFFLQPITMEFAAGAALALIYGRRPDDIPKAVAPAGLLMIMLGIFVVLRADMRYGDILNHDFELRLLWLGAPSVMIVAGALMLEAAGYSWRSRTILALGGASYALYLFHPVVIQASAKALETLLSTRNPATEFAVATFSMAMAVGFAVLVYHWLERPLHRWLRGAVRRCYHFVRDQIDHSLPSGR